MNAPLRPAPEPHALAAAIPKPASFSALILAAPFSRRARPDRASPAPVGTASAKTDSESTVKR